MCSPGDKEQGEGIQKKFEVRQVRLAEIRKGKIFSQNLVKNPSSVQMSAMLVHELFKAASLVALHKH
jgi:hypothetical protein